MSLAIATSLFLVLVHTCFGLAGKSGITRHGFYTWALVQISMYDFAQSARLCFSSKDEALLQCRANLRADISTRTQMTCCKACCERQDNLGPEFIEQSPFDMMQTYEESTCNTPMFFVLFPGSIGFDLASGFWGFP